MSWSFSNAGTPAEVSAAIDSYGDSLFGDSRMEFDAARPHLRGLVAQNYPERKLEVSASGHGADPKSRECTVNYIRAAAMLALAALLLLLCPVAEASAFCGHGCGLFAGARARREARRGSHVTVYQRITYRRSACANGICK